jgi:hypothetical protein
LKSTGSNLSIAAAYDFSKVPAALDHLAQAVWQDSGGVAVNPVGRVSRFSAD